MTQIEVAVRKASMRDVPNMLSLINSYAANGTMLPRTEFEMSENIRDFSVAYDAGRLVGCGALHFYTPTSAEVRSLAVLPAVKQHGIGRALVQALEEEAQENDLHAIFAFTYVPQFFTKLGFAEVERGELPLKAWKDCLRCPKFQNCDEIAVLKRLKPVVNGITYQDEHFGTLEELVQLPHIRSTSFQGSTRTPIKRINSI
ncbi:MAG TPA: N-acetyltransferase [Bryobacteraceae bacterium]|jgi:amino-acid N-acetyltransferase|nr:N-acetyltransferase [Bryobacteraceae bacterium]